MKNKHTKDLFDRLFYYSLPVLVGLAVVLLFLAFTNAGAFIQ